MRMVEHKRTRKNFDDGWRFFQGDHPVYSSPGFDDAGWRVLNLPHDFAIEGDYSKDAPGDRRQGYLPCGTGWYRKTFTLDADIGNSRTFIEFDGVYMMSDVWVNGHHLGRHPYGYTSFHYDLSPWLQEGENVLAVRATTDFELPTDRWYSGTGIYRHVWLTTAARTAIDYNGTFIRWEKKDDDTWDCTLDLDVRNVTPEPSDLVITTRVLDAEGNCALKMETAGTAAAEANTVFTQIGVLTRPRLWSPDEPNLYTAQTLLTVGGVEIDRYETRTGIRHVDLHAPVGFELNGIPTKFKGVCNHHDAGPLGAAVPDNVLRRRILELKEMGCNAIRTAHNPFSPEFYDLCDELGMMVMDEIFDGWHRKAGCDYGALAFDVHHRRDTRDWIIRDRNHPSVILWSIGNETGPEDIHGLTDICHQHDPTRLVTGGEMLRGVDIPGFNGGTGKPKAYAKWRAENPATKFVFTEKPHSYQTRGFYRSKTWWRDFNNDRIEITDLTDEEVFTEDYAVSHPHLCCYNSNYDNATVRMSARYSWARTRDCDQCLGEFRWTGHDYLGESFGWPFRSGNNGVIDLCGLRKDNYYLYQSMWSDEPMAHILPHWSWPGKEGIGIPVWVYSNCDEVELLLNGASLGRQTPRRNWENIQVQCLVPWEAGTLTAIGYRNGVKVTETSQTTDKGFSSLRLETDTLHGEDETRYAATVTVTSMDENGIYVPRGESRVYFHLDGPGRLMAVGNGDPVDKDPHRLHHRKLFAGMARGFVQLDSPAKPVGLTVFALCGDRYFKDGQRVAFVAEHVALHGGPSAPTPAVFFTTDGSTPTREAPRYTGPILLHDTATIKALVVMDGCEYFIEETFTRGDGIHFDPEAVPEGVRLSEDLVGTWKREDSDEHKLVFKRNAKVEIIINGEVTDLADWVYADPIDPFEFETGDEDAGRINYTWHHAELRCVKARLRVKTIINGVVKNVAWYRKEEG